MGFIGHRLRSFAAPKPVYAVTGAVAERGADTLAGEHVRHLQQANPQQDRQQRGFLWCGACHWGGGV